MDCGQRVEQMWCPSGEGTRMDDFRARVNRELQLTLSKCTVGFHSCLATAIPTLVPRALVSTFSAGLWRNLMIFIAQLCGQNSDLCHLMGCI